MPETEKKNQECQLLIDLLTNKDANNQIYYFQIKGGKYFNPLSETVLVSHIENKSATGVNEFMKYVEKAKNFDFDFISVELFTKTRRHEIDAQKPFDTRKIIINEPPKPNITPVLSRENEIQNQNQILGMVQEKLDIREAIMTKDFEIASLKVQNAKLHDSIKKTSIRIGELKDLVKKIKTRYFRIKKDLVKTKEKSEKEIENLKDDVAFKKLITNGLGTLASGIKIKGQNLGDLLGSFIDLPDKQEDNNENANSSKSQNFNIRTENNGSQDTELDIIKKEMLRQVELYLKDKDEKKALAFYKILGYITNNDQNMETILDLIKE